MKNICIVAGARPNFVKVAPLIRAIENTKEASYHLVYAGREDDPTLEPSLFDDLQMPRPSVFLGVDSTKLNEITSRVMAEFDAYLDREPTDVVIVVDDLASPMAAARWRMEDSSSSGGSSVRSRDTTYMACSAKGGDMMSPRRL